MKNKIMKIGLSLNKLAMLMDDSTFQKCKDTLKEIESGVAELIEPQWIPCNERLPFDFQIVNVVWVNHNPQSYYEKIKDKPDVASCVFYKGKWYWYSCVCVDYLKEYGIRYEMDLVDDDIEITHWMPLPEPYNEVEEQ